MKYLFSQMLKKLCEKQNISIYELCPKVNISKSNIKKLVEGTRFPTIFGLEKIAKELGVTPMYLLTGTNFDDISTLKELPLTAKSSFILWYYKWIKKKSADITFTQLSTYCSDSQCILKEFKDKRLCDINWEDVDFFLSKQQDLSKRTLEHRKTFINQIFKFASACKQYNYNPTLEVTIPKSSSKPIPTEIISPETRREIMSFEHEMQLAAVIMLLAGLRRGEILALTYRDINLFNGHINVNKVVEMLNGSPVIRLRAKSDAGVRKVDIPEVLTSFILNYLGKHPEKKPDDLILPNKFGRPLTSKGFYRKWNDYISQLNLRYGNFTKSELKAIDSISELPLNIERFTSKQLRHTYATMLYLSGTDVLVAKEQLGHSKITTTLDFYCHLDKKYKKRTISMFDNFLSTEAFSA